MEGQLSVDGPEFDQCPVTADVAIGAGPAGQCQILRGWPWDGGGLGGDAAARQPEYGGAAGQDGVRGTKTITQENRSSPT